MKTQLPFGIFHGKMASAYLPNYRTADAPENYFIPFYFLSQKYKKNGYLQ